MIKSNSGSFRDPSNRVYEVGPSAKSRVKAIQIFRGVNQAALENYRALAACPFYQDFEQKRQVVKTTEKKSGDAVKKIKADGWTGVLHHETISFVSYPYEWSFGMLKDAALLHLEIIETSLENGWTLKDATPFNIQWVNGKPIFIDLPSFEPWVKGTPWVGYRQFCSMFLTPLMLRAHLGIDHIPIVRSYLDGIPPTEAIKFFNGFKRYKKGVLSHIVLPAKVENAILKRERDGVEAKNRMAGKHSKPMVVGLVQSLRRLVGKLSIDIAHTDWSHYDRTHSYQDAELDEKKRFVDKHAGLKKRKFVWDIGCNTGTFSKIAASHADLVLSLDGDHDAIEQLYQREKAEPETKLHPMVMNLANISPNQGWGGVERAALDSRTQPDLVMCLALIHHTRISANIPNVMFLSWLRKLDADIIIEFVKRSDEMVVKLLTNKTEQYADYNIDRFTQECEQLFKISGRMELKGGKREIFYLTPE